MPNMLQYHRSLKRTILEVSGHEASETWQSSPVFRQHVFEDLPPYVCTHKHCSRADRPFSRRREWHQHQANMHDRSWLCPFGCTELIMSADLFQQHLECIHRQGLQPNVLQRMVESCARVDESVGPFSCVVCDKTKSYGEAVV